MRRQQTGFTLIGLLIVVSILALASTATMTSINLMARRQAEDQLLLVGAQYSKAFQRYVESTPTGGKRFPMSLQDLLRDPRYSETRRYLREVYPDPLNGKISWGLIASPEGGIQGIYSNSPGKPIKQQHFTGLTEQTFAGAPDYQVWQFGWQLTEAKVRMAAKKHNSSASSQTK